MLECAIPSVNKTIYLLTAVVFIMLVISHEEISKMNFLDKVMTYCFFVLLTTLVTGIPIPGTINYYLFMLRTLNNYFSILYYCVVLSGLVRQLYAEYLEFKLELSHSLCEYNAAMAKNVEGKRGIWVPVDPLLYYKVCTPPTRELIKA